MYKQFAVVFLLECVLYLTNLTVESVVRLLNMGCVCDNRKQINQSKVCYKKNVNKGKGIAGYCK